MTIYNDSLSLYISTLFAGEDDALQKIPAASLAQGLPEIQVSAEEGAFLQVMAAACSARKALEIGALGGYSAVWIARGLLPGGRLISLEGNPLHAGVTRKNIEHCGLEEKVEIRLGNALDLLPGLVAEAPFDFVFIDADKANYIRYFDWAVENTRPGAFIAVHNAFWYGAVLREGELDEDTLAIQRLNQHAAQHPGVLSTIFPAGDGTLICARR